MKNLLKYKEYLGTVSFSNEDQCLYAPMGSLAPLSPLFL